MRQGEWTLTAKVKGEELLFGRVSYGSLGPLVFVVRGGLFVKVFSDEVTLYVDSLIEIGKT